MKATASRYRNDSDSPFSVCHGQRSEFLSVKKSCSGVVFHGAGQKLEYQSFVIPELQEGEVIVRIDACTVCGSDLHTVGGKRKEKTPTILGHEAVGRIEEMAGTVPDGHGQPLQKGDRVTWSVCASCFACDRCEAGFTQKCRHLKKFGHEQVSASGPLFGGFLEYAHLNSRSSIFRVPEDLDDKLICPANCATATVMATIDAAGSVAGRNVLIIGAGMLGLTAGACCREAGAKEIVFVERSEARRELATLFGATDSLERMESVEGSFDVVFDFAGVASLIGSSIELLNIGGTLVLAGTVMPSPDISINPEMMVRKLLSIHGVHNYRPDHLASAIEFLAQSGGDYPFAQLVEQTFSFDRINEALEFAIAQQPVRVMIKS